MRHVLLLACTAALVGAGAAPASAATSIGRTAGPYPESIGASGSLFVQSADPAGSNYAVPAGGGVITQIRVHGNLSPNVVVVRGSAATGFTYVATTTFSGISVANVTTQAVRIPVQAGDRLGMHTGADFGTVRTIADSGTVQSYTGVTSTPSGGSTATATKGTSSTRQLAIGATVEPDTDGDGYGDETQDACPGQASRVATPCGTDLALSASSNNSTIPVGGAALVTVPVKVVQGGGPSATVSFDVPSGLRLLTALTAGGTCSGTTCSITPPASGEERTVYAFVEGIAPGSAALKATATSDGLLHSTADDAATVSIDVTPPSGPAAPVVVPTPITVLVPAPAPAPAPAETDEVELCTIPSLKGKTRAQATEALTDEGCAVGKVTGSKTKKAKVKTQTLPSKLQVVAGTKVGFKLG